eukprot:Em0028g44a
MGVQNRKRKQVVSLSLSVPASKRFFLSPMSDVDFEACHDDNQGVLSGTSQSILAQKTTVHRRLSDSSVESRGSLSADSGVEVDSTTGCNRSPCALVSRCTKQVEQNTTDQKSTPQPICRLQTELAQDDCYVRRLASLNAQACVSALFASKPRVQLKCLNSDCIMCPTPRKLFGTEQKCIEEEKSFYQHELIRDSLDDKCRVNSGMDDQHFSHRGWTKLHTDELNGSLHSQLVQPPAIVPSKIKNVVEIVERLKATPITPSMKSKRGDNRWSFYGDPIRELQYHHPKTSDCMMRKYYVGIKRKEEEIFVRDCILVKGSSAKKPYIAKVASFWQEKGGIMMTLFWYYRPEDVQDLGVRDFTEGELLASEHHDENTVACIEEKCYVIGLSQYCRFKAARRREDDSLGLPGASSILPKSIEDTPIKGHWLPSSDTDSSLVFLCHRGYNHLTGRLLRSSPSK